MICLLIAAACKMFSCVHQPKVHVCMHADLALKSLRQAENESKAREVAALWRDLQGAGTAIDALSEDAAALREQLQGAHAASDAASKDAAALRRQLAAAHAAAEAAGEDAAVMQQQLEAHSASIWEKSRNAALWQQLQWTRAEVKAKMDDAAGLRQQLEAATVQAGVLLASRKQAEQQRDQLWAHLRALGSTFLRELP